MSHDIKTDQITSTHEPASNAKANVLFVRFALGQRVTIDAIDTRGIIKAIEVTTGATEYRVAYFDDDKVRRVEWFEDTELSR